MRTYIAVDGGMSDNMRPMLYGARYEALIANRAAEPADTPATVAGMHCESGDILVQDAMLASPRAGDLLVTPATGAYGYAMASNYNGLPRPGGRVLLRRGRPRGRAARDVRRPAGPRRRMSAAEPIRIGVLGRGTVGGAFAELLAAAADAVEEATGRRPEIAGVLRRSEGSYDEILAGSEIVVELIGGTEPARDYVLRALRDGRHVVTANKQLIAQHGDELFEAAREAGVQIRFEAAVAGVIPVIRVIQESLSATEITRVFGIVNGTTNYILTEMANTGASYDDALARAQELGYAEADPSDDVGGADAAAKMAILARLAFHTPVELDDVSFEGIEAIQPDDLAYAKQFGLSLKLLGVAERHGDEISVRVFPCFLYSGHPLAPVGGAVQRRHGRVAVDHRDNDVGPGRRRDRDRGGRARGRRLDRRRRCARFTPRASALR